MRDADDRVEYPSGNERNEGLGGRIQKPEGDQCDEQFPVRGETVSDGTHSFKKDVPIECGASRFLMILVGHVPYTSDCAPSVLLEPLSKIPRAGIFLREVLRYALLTGRHYLL